MNATVSDDYELLDSGNGAKLERFGPYIMSRPCAQAIWLPQKKEAFWAQAQARFDRVQGHNWHNREAIPASWNIRVADLLFRLSSTDFGHLGIFPEQRELWLWLKKVTRQAATTLGRPPNILNLFAYSGGATLAAASAGAKVCHLDASKGMVDWARENAALNKLETIRWIVDDAIKFLQREAKRENYYDGIILDPPTFGRGAKGEIYKAEKQLITTLELCQKLLSPSPIFVLLSSHTPGYTPIVLENLLLQTLNGARKEIRSGEMLLTGPNTYPLPSGAYAHWLAPKIANEFAT